MIIIPFSAARGRPGMVIKKYVVWCLVCGGFSCILGLLFLGVYFLLHSYTITVGNFETVPTFVPATLVSSLVLCKSFMEIRNIFFYLFLVNFNWPLCHEPGPPSKSLQLFN